MKLINHIEYYQNSCCLSFMECLQKKEKWLDNEKEKLIYFRLLQSLKNDKYRLKIGNNRQKFEMLSIFQIKRDAKLKLQWVIRKYRLNIHFEIMICKLNRSSSHFKCHNKCSFTRQLYVHVSFVTNLKLSLVWNTLKYFYFAFAHIPINTM